MNILSIIIAIVCLIIGGASGYSIFRYLIKGKYNTSIKQAKKEAEVIKEKKLLEVKEKFLNKKAESKKKSKHAIKKYSKTRIDLSNAKYHSTNDRKTYSAANKKLNNNCRESKTKRKYCKQSTTSSTKCKIWSEPN